MTNLTLTLTLALKDSSHAKSFVTNLSDSISIIEKLEGKLGNFCSVCRIFLTISKSQLIDNKSKIESKLIFQIHSGSMIEEYEKLYREIDLQLFNSHSDLRYQLIRIP